MAGGGFALGVKVFVLFAAGKQRIKYELRTSFQFHFGH
jgi:hypothetical protein